MTNRPLCLHCRKAEVMCYCADLRPFANDPAFIILLHPKERRKAINTGRMAYLCLQNAWLFEGIDFSEHAALNQVMNDKSRRCYLLFPGSTAIDLPDLINGASEAESRCFIILDATWTMARKMYQQSRNLQALPQISFFPERPSEFSAVREQPSAHCFSTIETVHHILEESGRHRAGEHHVLLKIFRDMVSRQIDYERLNSNSPSRNS